MYRKVMMQIYLLEDVCKKLYVKVVFRNYNFVEKIVEKKSFQKGKLPCCPKSRATNPPNARALISWPRAYRALGWQPLCMRAGTCSSDATWRLVPRVLAPRWLAR